MRNFLIKKAISEIENKYPDDNLISSYKDFLEVRDFLKNYQYNQKVFISLIDLTHSLWHSKKRINRQSLIATSKRYFSLKTDNKELPQKTRNQLFELFKELVYYESVSTNKESLVFMQYKINTMVLDIEFTNKQIIWLLRYSDKSNIILNRVLRYKRKSSIISAWARENYKNNFYRHRRNEIASWIIDEQEDFEISKEDLIVDLNYSLKKDALVLDELDERLAIYEIAKDIMPKQYDSVVQETSEKKLKIRYKYSNLDTIRSFVKDRRNAKSVKEEFLNLPNVVLISNLYAVFYSRLDDEIKNEKLKRMYNDEIESLFIYLCRKYNNLDVLNWLLKKIDSLE